jgi:hypothetical protein
VVRQGNDDDRHREDDARQAGTAVAGHIGPNNSVSRPTHRKFHRRDLAHAQVNADGDITFPGLKDQPLQ